MTYIYILKLEDKCYYVGRTNNVEQRFEYHKSGYGSSWTKLHKPIKIKEIIENASPYDEDRYVKEYMAIYGIDNVRGGTYVKINLDNTQKQILQKEIWNAKDNCIRCGKEGHFIMNCYEKYNINNKKIIIPDEKIIISDTDSSENHDIYSGCSIL